MSANLNIFNPIWEDYILQNPAVKKVYDLFLENGETVLNDHIAFRTFDDPRVNIDVLARPFIEAGYEPSGEYHFEAKHLFARHYEHKTIKDAPRVFISQLISTEMPMEIRTIINETIEQIPESVLTADDLILKGRVWNTPSYKVYEMLRATSEYAAWLYVYGFRANHFTVSINALKKFDTIEKVNNLLKENGFLMNDSGGEVKGTPEELLEQSSIKAGTLEVEFTEGVKSIPSCYYEFAKRYPDVNGELYGGFIAKSADKIFESTNFYSK